MAGLALDLDRAGTVPLYDQVAQQLQAAIEGGTLSQGTLLGNEITLARELGVSRPTMRRALQELVTRGLLVRKRGVGTQVVQGRVDRQVQLTSLFDDLVADGRAPETTVLINDVVQASDEVSAALHVARRQPVLHLRRIRSACGEPLAILENYLPTDLLPVGESDLRSVGLYQAMRAAGVRMKVARQRIGAREGRTEECRLDEPATSPLLTMDRITHDDTGVPVEWGRHVYRPGRYTFSITLTGR